MLLMWSWSATTPSSRRFFTSYINNRMKPQKTQFDWHPFDTSSLGKLEHQEYLVTFIYLSITIISVKSELRQLSDVVPLW